MRPPQIATHEGECMGTGTLQYIESKAGEKDKGVYRCYNCGRLFKKEVEE